MVCFCHGTNVCKHSPNAFLAISSNLFRGSFAYLKQWRPFRPKHVLEFGSEFTLQTVIGSLGNI